MPRYKNDGGARALHPVHAESVAARVGLADLGCAAAVFGLLRLPASSCWSRAAAVVLLSAAALLFKEIGATALRPPGPGVDRPAPVGRAAALGRAEGDADLEESER